MQFTTYSIAFGTSTASSRSYEAKAPFSVTDIYNHSNNILKCNIFCTNLIGYKEKGPYNLV